MTTSDESGRGKHVGPDGGAWEEAQRNVRERNDKARAAGREQRLNEERRAATQRALRERGQVYR